MHIVICIASLLGLTAAQNPSHKGVFAITNVSIFDGWDLLPGGPHSVIVKDGLIDSNLSKPLSSSAVAEMPILDGRQQLLLPGFLDTHVHVDDAATDLVNMRSQGITTAFDMACQLGKEGCDAHNLAKHAPISNLMAGSPDHDAFVKNVTSLGPFPELFQAYHPAIAPVGLTASMGPPEYQLHNTTEAEAHVAARVAEGADHIKIISSTPGFDLDMLKALTGAAKLAGKTTICHAVDIESFINCIKADCDQLHHVPIDQRLSHEDLTLVKDSGKVVAPTLVQMKGVTEGLNAMWVILAMDIWNTVKGGFSGQGFVWAKRDYGIAKENVRLLAAAGVPLIMGTDATGEVAPIAFTIHMATGFQQELRFLTDAGVDALTILRGMTDLAADRFRLSDRGRILQGRRADLVMVNGDPLSDITDLDNVKAVWIGGIEADLSGRLLTRETAKDEL